MNCPKCGNEMKDGQMYCENCGGEIRIVPDFEPETENSMELALHDIEKALIPEPVLRKTGRKIKNYFFLLSRRRRWLWCGGGAVLFLLTAVLLLAAAGDHDAQYQYDLAQKHMNLKQYERAYPHAQRAYDLDPQNIEYAGRLAQCSYELGMEEETLKVCAQIIAMDGSNDAAYKRMVSIYAKQEDYEEINTLLLNCRDGEIVNQYGAYMAKPPQFSYEGGTYSETLNLKISANTKGTIYYTMDTTPPDEESLVYAAPLFLETGNYTVRSVFINSYGVKSKETSAEYFVDVTVPQAPVVMPDSGSYSRPQMINAESVEEADIYYSTDGTDPTMDSLPYVGPVPMPVGNSSFKFVAYSRTGAAGVITERKYSLNMQAALTIESALNKLLLELINTGIIRDITGKTVKTNGNNVYKYKYALTIGEADYYLYREYYEDASGNRAGTGADYVVNVMSGDCYKTVHPEDEGEDGVILQMLDAGGNAGAVAESAEEPVSGHSTKQQP